MDLRSELEQHLGTAYRLDRELGGGGMSRVFVAEDMRLHRQVVVKVLSPELAQGLNVDRFEREIQLAASLQQANIVPLHSAGDVGGLPYFTMPFIEGESLRTRLARGPMPVKEVVSVLRDVARALAYAHGRGVVHRDIKPDNVLLSGGAAVVTDFGIAKAISASRTDTGDRATLTQLGTALGTPAYMAPEQVAGDPNVDHRADLYALGCVAFELLTGQQPFGNRTPQRMLAAHLTEPAPDVLALRPDSPPALADMVRRLMAKNPDERPQTASELDSLLDASSTTTSGTTVAFAAPGMFKKAMLWYVAALVAVAIVAKAAVVGIGLPDWVFPGAILVMALGLPALLATAYVQRVARQSATATPTLTPGGTSVARPPGGTMANVALKASSHLTWRRATKAGYIAIGVFVLMVAGFMILRGLGIGPWGSLFAAGTLKQDDKIVVADFVSPSGDSTLGPILSEAVRTALGQSKSVRPMEAASVADILQQMKRPRTSRLDAATAREVATRAGAAAVLGGKIASAGAGYVVSMDLTSATDGHTLASVQGSAGGPTELLPTVDKLTRQLRSRMGESLKQVRQSAPLARVTTSSLEALKKYTEARRVLDLNSDFERAIPLLREAVALDSTFAMAWRALAIVLSYAVYPTPSIDSALAQAVKYADRLPDRERYAVLGRYYTEISPHQDRGKAIAAYRMAYAADSDDVIAASNLSSLFAGVEQYDSALSYARREYRLRPGIGGASGLAWSLADAGEADSAARMLRQMWADSAPTPALVRARYHVFLAQGLIDSALTVLKTASQSANSTLRGDINYSLTSIRMTRGQLRQAEAAGDIANAAYASNGGFIAPPLSIEDDIRFRGRAAEGARRLDSVLASPGWLKASEDTRSWAYADMAGQYALAGRPDRARDLLEHFAHALPDLAASAVEQPALASARGEIALAENNLGEALTQFRASQRAPDGGRPLCVGCADYGIGRVFDRMGKPDSAIAYFNRYLARPRTEREYADYFALAGTQKRLGELYDAKGDTADAVKHYAAFTELWKDADPDLQPVVQTVKKRLGELTAR